MTILKPADYKKQGLTILRSLVNTYHSETLDFELCNGYIIQATRNGYWHVHKNQTIIFFTKKAEADNFVIVSAAGLNHNALIKETAKYLFHENKKPVIIKNVNKERETKLLDAGFRHYRVNEWWDETTKYDDNTFPEQILNVRKTIELKDQKFKSFREDKQRFFREYSITIRESKDIPHHDKEKLFDTWITDLHKRKGWDKQALREANQMFFEDNENFLVYGMFDNKNNKLIGYLSFSEISQTCLGHNALITNLDYRNSYRIFIYEAARIAHDRGYIYLNIQGSEDTSQYLSKKRMHAEIEIHKQHLLFDGQTCCTK